MQHVVATHEFMSISIKRASLSVRAHDGNWYRVALPCPGRNSAYKALGALLVGACIETTAEPVAIEFGTGVVSELQAKGFGLYPDFSLASGIFMGSRYVADPENHAVYDLLPSKLMERVKNYSIFSVVRGIDVWIGNANPNHAVYVRQPDKDFRAHLVGFGQAFRFGDHPRRLFAQEQAAFEYPDSWEQTMGGVDRLNRLADSVLREFARSVPIDWWATADRPARQIIDQLLHRRDQLPAMLSAIRRESEGGTQRRNPGRVARGAGRRESWSVS